MKHTQGEWIQNGNNGIHLKSGECIAITEGENRKDNAKLIAAAPKMLKAMKVFVDRVDNGEIRSTKTYNSFKEIIKEATE